MALNTSSAGEFLTEDIIGPLSPLEIGGIVFLIGATAWGLRKLFGSR